MAEKEYYGLRVEVKDWIATVTLDRPPANAGSVEMYNAIRYAFHDLDEREDVKVVVLTGEGKIFMGGNDLEEIANFLEKEACIQQFDLILHSYLAVKNCRYPVVGAINGAAAGAGCAFAACCDVIVAAEKAKFILPEIKLGVIGADGFTSMMVPEKVLRYMALSGNPVLAEEIAQYGGIRKVVPREEVLPEAMKIAREFAQNSRYALLLWKEVLNENYDHELPRKFERDCEKTIAHGFHKDFRESYEATLEKREPKFDEQ